MKYSIKFFFFFLIVLFNVACNIEDEYFVNDTVIDSLYFNFSLQSESDNILTYVSDSDDVHISIIKFINIDYDIAVQYVDDNFLLLNSLYVTQRASYPGQFTTQIECPIKFHPSYFEEYSSEGFYRYYNLSANGNYVYGVCSDDLVIYNSLYGFLYCNNNLYEIKFYLSKDSLRHSLADISSQIKC